MASSYKKFYKAEEVLNILDAINPNDSDLDDDSTDDEEDILDFPNLAQDFNSTIDPTLSDNESEPDEQQPSTSSPPSTSKRKTYSWRKAIFETPDIEFRGETQEIFEEDATKSPIQYFKEYLTNNMLDLLVTMTNQYSVEKNGKSIDTNRKELEQVLGMFLRMGLVKMPGNRCYWETETRYEPIAGVMSRNRFQKLLSVLHFVDNSKVPEEQKQDKLWKIRPWLEMFRENCLKAVPEEYNSIDEMMIPFKGKFSKIKQYIKGKPHPWGIKVWSRCSSSGMLYDFDVYQGNKDKKSKSVLGIGADVVLKLCSTLPDNNTKESPFNYKITADNFFTSLPLLSALQKINIHYIGTVRPNRIPGCLLLSESELKKKGRGTMDQCIEKNTNIVAVRWYDTRAVNILSTYSGKNPTNYVTRYEKAQGKHIQVECPAVIKLYNEHMGGVDLHDCYVAKNSYRMKSKRWYIYIFWQTIRMMLVNAWLSYRQVCKILGISGKDIMTQRSFQGKLASLLVDMNSCKKTKRGKLSNTPTPPRKRQRQLMPQDEVRTDGFYHFMVKASGRQRCKICRKKSPNLCEKCNVYLCFTNESNCFKQFHLSL